jgi:hypothetical protein
MRTNRAPRCLAPEGPNSSSRERSSRYAKTTTIDPEGVKPGANLTPSESGINRCGQPAALPPATRVQRLRRWIGTIQFCTRRPWKAVVLGDLPGLV